MLSIIFVLGTRPEIIKMAPLILEADKRKIKHTIIHTGQHYDENLSSKIFDSLCIRSPDHNLRIEKREPYKQLSEMIEKLGEIYLEIEPSIVLSVGDTNSVLASSLACIKTKIPYGHIESGLRSFDFTMPEEINRRLVDHMSSILFAPSERAVINLSNEGINESRIHLTGNTVIDSVRIFSSKLREMETKSADEILADIKTPYILATIHRVANVESKSNLEEIAKFLAKYTKHPIILLIHPRTKGKLEEFNLIKEIKQNTNVHVYSPVEYLSLLKLLRHENCLLVLTDSGGLQEEASFLKKPCITVRSNTERPETVEHQINFLVEARASLIVKKIDMILSEDFEYRFSTFKTPYGDGNASQKIMDIIETNIELLEYVSPKNYRSGSKSFNLLEMGVTMDKELIEEQFQCQVVTTFDEDGYPKMVEDKIKKGDRVRVLKD
jgi:UDP-N-acetylglucosamine 2-epimerase (non-hydrolysing)